MKTIQVKRGLKASLPTLAQGEFGFVTDYNELYIGNTSGNLEISTRPYIDTKLQEIKSLPAGGTTGQVLAKSSDNDYETNWVNISNDFIKLDGTSTTTAKIPFSNGISIDNFSISKNSNDSSLEIKTDSSNQINIINTTNKLLIGDSISATTSTDSPYEATNDSDIVTKKYLVDYVNDNGGSTISVLDVTLESTGWTESQARVWKQTITNSAITINKYILVDADISEHLAHINDTPVTSLLVGEISEGSVAIYAISDNAPSSNYNIKLLIQDYKTVE